IDTPDGKREIATRLLVGADGSDSIVREQLGIGADVHDYRQTLFVATVTPQHAPAGRAYERFSDDGPVALLPLAGDRAGLVLTVPSGQADAVAAMDDAAFLTLAQYRFGWRLGHLEHAGKRSAHAIRRVAAQIVTAPRAVLAGNAAQTVHPIGAQGFNLGLRDALTLSELVADAPDPGIDPLLAEYAGRRAPDRDGVMAMSHGLIRLACLRQPLLAPLRTLGLLAFDRLPTLRRGMARRGMGFRGKPPRDVLETLPWARRRASNRARQCVAVAAAPCAMRSWSAAVWSVRPPRWRWRASAWRSPWSRRANRFPGMPATRSI